MTGKLHLRPVQFVDTPIGRDGEVARLAGGMAWFGAYEVIEGGNRRTISVAEFEAVFVKQNERAAHFHAAITRPRPSLTLGDRVLRFDQPWVAGILNMTPDSFSDGGKLQDDNVAAADGGSIGDGQGARR